MMEKDMFLLYEAPVVEVLEVNVEKGFSASNNDNTPEWEGGNI